LSRNTRKRDPSVVSKVEPLAVASALLKVVSRESGIGPDVPIGYTDHSSPLRQCLEVNLGLLAKQATTNPHHIPIQPILASSVGSQLRLEQNEPELMSRQRDAIEERTHTVGIFDTQDPLPLPFPRNEVVEQSRPQSS